MHQRCLSRPFIGSGDSSTQRRDAAVTPKKPPLQEEAQPQQLQHHCLNFIGQMCRCCLAANCRFTALHKQTGARREPCADDRTPLFACIHLTVFLARATGLGSGSNSGLVMVLATMLTLESGSESQRRRR